MIASIVILCASLSTESLGEFFTLPAWIPRSVPSRETIGSDPTEATNGWYVADATNAYPRACRTSPANQAAVNASFEGFFERMYYASQAQSNVWPTAVYGPPTRSGFRFDLPANDRVFEYPTNRVIRSRRLQEYDALISLEHYVRHEFYADGSVDSVIRPGWIAKDTLWWGTKGAVMPDAFIPTFGWTEEPTMHGPSWAGVCAVWAHLYNDEIWVGRTQSPYVYGPSRELMERLRLGQSVQEYSSWRCEWQNDEHVTLRGVIETNFPHADGWAITNQTRRMQSDHICCLNQVLGLMNRTYHLPGVEYPTVGTNRTYRNEVDVRGTVHATLTESAGGYVVTPTEGIAWEPPTTTNRVSVSGVASSGTAYHWRVGETATMAGVTAEAEVPAAASDETVTNVIEAAITAGFVPVQDQLYHINMIGRTQGERPVIDATVYDADYSTSEIHVTVDADISLSDVNLGIYLTYYREYAYAKTAGYLGIGATQPGVHALDTNRAAENRYGVVSCYRSRVGDVSTSLSEMARDAGDTVRYKSVNSTYTRRSELVNAIETPQGEIYALMAAEYGFAPTAWQSIIPIDSYDVGRVRDSVDFPDTITLRFSPRFCFTDVALTFDQNLDPVVLSVETREEEVTRPGYGQFFTLALDCEMTHASPSQQERDGIAYDARAGILTRTDWNWKTLKME